MTLSRDIFALVLPLTVVCAAMGAMLGWWAVLVAPLVFAGSWFASAAMR